MARRSVAASIAAARETTDLSASRPEFVREAMTSLRDPKLEFFVGAEATVDRATRERFELLGYTE